MPSSSVDTLGEPLTPGESSFVLLTGLAMGIFLRFGLALTRAFSSPESLGDFLPLFDLTICFDDCFGSCLGICFGVCFGGSFSFPSCALFGFPFFE